ncbi:GT2 family glycosyltransferase [Lacibacter cauensis]|uniref:GT2 family glycosyltransferase n=1 Tax=Lacibacter cauensis TaxID=510947 RepID=A0A562SRN0_9BACT|nr:glycosyltransferase [Lacibacter cauensis]TWI83674.1 GT2 family glycosyltransferase [Lacibacter cauensis]
MKIGELYNKLTYSIKKTEYCYSDNTANLNNVPKFNKVSFAPYGSNMCIVLLSLNRVNLTIRLLTSVEYYIPEFKGEILIIDNNSSAAQKKLLKEFTSTCSCPIKIIELQENLGVGNARNYAASQTKKDWIMFLDNDMFFVEDPLESVQQAINTLGVNFLNLPLINYDNKSVFALGGALFTWPTNETFFSGGGSCYNFKTDLEYNDLEIEAPFLSDFLFGGACILNRQEFLDIGGFDRNMFVGFEDIDFSLRLYKKGYKIGNLHKFVVVHNHKPSSDKDDIEAEKKRFNNDIIKASAEAFEKKNGLVVYDKHTEDWLKQKQDQLITASTSKKGDEIKKRIALIVDVKNWAFHNIAKNIEHHLSHKYNFTIYFQSEYAWEKWLDLYPILYKEKYDLLFFFWRPVYKHLFSVDLKNYLEYKFSISRNQFEDFLNETILLTGVYDHLYLQELDKQNNIDIFNNNIDGYFVSSHKLMNIYNKISEYKKPYCVIQDGVDINKFYRKKEKAFSSHNSPLVVGWAGNSAWGQSEDGIDHKGFISIIKPAVEELIQEGYAIKLTYADKQEPHTHIDPANMVDYYNQLDVYICASDIEGTPNPVLESMACGIAVISTDVGIVKEVFGKLQKEYILTERSKEALKKLLLNLIKNREILESLSKENEIRIKNWTWEGRCERFDELFDYYFNQKEMGKLHKKQFPYNSAIYREQLHTNEHLSNFPEINNSQLSTNTTKDTVNTLEQISLEKAEAFSELANYWEKNASEIKSWYHKEYEVLPLWYKRFGHIIKVIRKDRSLKSLFSKSQ